MAVYTAGDILEITCKHPELGDFRFQVKANEACTIDFGGVRSNDDANGITGGGDFIDQMNRVRWSLETVASIDFVSGNETRSFNEMTESLIHGIWTVSHISGVVWKGKGKPVGDINFDSNTAQGPLKLAGAGKLESLS